MRGQTAAPEAGAGRRAACPHLPACDGCSLIGTAYGAQMDNKRARVAEALAAYPSLSGVEVPPVVGAPKAFGYRNQAKLVARGSRRGLLLGIYRAGTHQVVDIPECPVQHPALNEVLARVRTEIDRCDVPLYDERSREGWLRYVVARTSGWQRRVQLVLVARDDRWPGLRGLAAALRRVRGVGGVALNLNDQPGNAIFGPSTRMLSGEPLLMERFGALKLGFGPASFLQANVATARRVYERALQWAEPRADDVAVDLYAGVGAIAFSLATRARTVWGVEESGAAVRDAKRNVRLNGVHNVRFLAAPAADGMRDLAARLAKIDIVTLNPPRKGADEQTREAIASAGPSRVVYVSCNPDTLARDIDWFAGRGYGVTAVQPFDMMPQTDHVETVALLARL